MSRSCSGDLENYLNWIPRLIAQGSSMRFLLLAMDCFIELEELQHREVS
jgi:hypothetical protein